MVKNYEFSQISLLAAKTFNSQKNSVVFVLMKVMSFFYKGYAFFSFSNNSKINLSLSSGLIS